ncbi:MAG: PAS domain-containing protein [Deltaproteobacteria bacterium]|nr:PAS domain-containing protein [Deltaproteobacteria bacterium]
MRRSKEPVVKSLADRLLAAADAVPVPASPAVHLAALLTILRWIAVLGLAAVLGASIVSGRVPAESWSRLWAVWGAMAVFNAVVSGVGPARFATQRSLSLQLAADVLFLAALLQLAGGITNPFSGIFVLQAAVIPVILEEGRAKRAIALLVLFIAGLTALEATGVAPPGCLRGADGLCPTEIDPLGVAAAGASVVVLVVFSSLMVLALISQLRNDRDRLSRATADLAREAIQLGDARATLWSEREKLQALVECMADAVVFAAPDGRVLLHNRAAAGLWTDKPGAERDLHVCHERDKWSAMLEKLTNPGPEEAHPTLTLGGRHYEATYARVALADGTLFGAVMIARDITERVLEQASNMHKERMATVGKLAAGLAHEINNPLGAIALFTEHAIKKLGSGSPLTEHLETVLRNTNQCKKIVHDLLDYARQRLPERRHLGVAELLGDVARTLAPHCERAQVELSVVRAPGSPEQVFGDRDQLRQVLVNLGLNSLEAMGGKGRLSFAVADGPRPVISVIDDGPGIAPEHRDKIFSEFFTTKPEGTGLGLAVARDIALAHRGRLYLDPSHTPGCRFVLELPVRAESDAEAEA